VSLSVTRLGRPSTRLVKQTFVSDDDALLVFYASSQLPVAQPLKLQLALQPPAPALRLPVRDHSGPAKRRISYRVDSDRDRCMEAGVESIRAASWKIQGNSVCVRMVSAQFEREARMGLLDFIKGQFIEINLE